MLTLAQFYKAINRGEKKPKHWAMDNTDKLPLFILS